MLTIVFQTNSNGVIVAFLLPKFPLFHLDSAFSFLLLSQSLQKEFCHIKLHNFGLTCYHFMHLGAFSCWGKCPSAAEKLSPTLQDLATVQKQTNTVQDRSENKHICSNGNTRSHSGSGLLSPNLELSWDTRPTQLLSQRLPQWSVDILHGRRSINSSVQIYTKQINCCNHIIKSFQKNCFPTSKVILKPLSQR